MFCSIISPDNFFFFSDIRVPEVVNAIANVSCYEENACIVLFSLPVRFLFFFSVLVKSSLLCISTV